MTIYPQYHLTVSSNEALALISVARRAVVTEFDASTKKDHKNITEILSEAKIIVAEIEAMIKRAALWTD